MEREKRAEAIILSMLPILGYLAKVTREHGGILMQDGDYYVFAFKSRGRGVGRGGRQGLPDEFTPLREQFLKVISFYPKIAEKYGLRKVTEGKKHFVYVKREVIDKLLGIF